MPNQVYEEILDGLEEGYEFSPGELDGLRGFSEFPLGGSCDFQQGQDWDISQGIDP
jgi:hypothetical protein